MCKIICLVIVISLALVLVILLSRSDTYEGHTGGAGHGGAGHGIKNLYSGWVGPGGYSISNAVRGWPYWYEDPYYDYSWLYTDLPCNNGCCDFENCVTTGICSWNIGDTKFLGSPEQCVQTVLTNQ